jgi:hypothetical protein
MKEGNMLLAISTLKKSILLLQLFNNSTIKITEASPTENQLHRYTCCLSTIMCTVDKFNQLFGISNSSNHSTQKSQKLVLLNSIAILFCIHSKGIYTLSTKAFVTTNLVSKSFDFIDTRKLRNENSVSNFLPIIKAGAY